MNLDPEHGVEFEPHLRRGHAIDPSEITAMRNLGKPARPVPEIDELRHSVWEEPGLSSELVGETSEARFGDWLVERYEQLGSFRSWMWTLFIALAAGPWAIVGTMIAGGESMVMLLAVGVIGPFVEELMKMAAITYVIERKPYVFRSAFQILLCGLASGLAFAAIENLLYLNVYVPNPEPALVTWRWSICTLLHCGCSAIAACGIVRIWHDLWARRAWPTLSLGYPYLLTAIVLHGAYNITVTVLEAGGFLVFDS